MARAMTPRRLRRAMNLWPPYLFTGVRVLHIADDWSEVRVALRLRRWNRNYVGTQFGGSLSPAAAGDPVAVVRKQLYVRRG
jgi:hypothetical protein